jgi:multidrug resistance efflux pump
MARKYKNVQGTNDFLVAAIGLTLLGLWAVRDAWFPTPKILEKHPLTAEVAFEDSGEVDQILVEVGMSISSNAPLLQLSARNLDQQQERVEDKLGKAEAELRRLNAAALAGAGGDSESGRLVAEKEEQVKELRRELAGIKQNRLRHIIRSEYKGKVQEIRVAQGDGVEADEVAAVINVQDYFYTFNKSLAIGSLLGALVCAIIHIKLK